jgi:hypothetical protein
MKTQHYKKSFLLFTHLVLASILTLFTIAWSIDYKRNLPEGYIFSALILLIYFFTIYKSATLFNKGSVAAAYFLTISGFVVLAFSEMVNCSNSMRWMH